MTHDAFTAALLQRGINWAVYHRVALHPRGNIVLTFGYAATEDAATRQARERAAPHYPGFVSFKP
jgi:hypothetical protein